MPTLKEVNESIIGPALELLPGRMDSPIARQMLLSIGMQESRFLHRRQLNNGPAASFWQFERGGGIRGVMEHPRTRQYAEALCRFFVIPYTRGDIWKAMLSNDLLGCCMARLLLWSDPLPMPRQDDAGASWDLYIRCWRPGKPHPQTWRTFYLDALEALA